MQNKCKQQQIQNDMVTSNESLAKNSVFPYRQLPSGETEILLKMFLTSPILLAMLYQN